MVLQDFISLCTDNSQVAYRPDEYPINGRCPFANCTMKMEEYV